MKQLKPQDEAVKRWWRWRYGYHKEVPSVEQMWLDFGSWRELEKNGGGLTYKQMYYEKMQEIAEEQYELLQEIEQLPNLWRVAIENLDEEGVDFTEGKADGIEDCISDLGAMLFRHEEKVLKTA